VLSVLRWLLPAVIPAVLVAILVWRSDKEREPPWLVGSTFALGAIFGAGAFWIEKRASVWTGLDTRTSVAGDAGALLFLFALVAPMREAAKVAATWPAFRSKHFDEPYDGVVYSTAAALGFATLENALMLRADPNAGWIGWARVLFALPAHVFFACAWGYALGRAKQIKRPGAIFPAAWLIATAAHGLYAHLVYGRGPGALVATLPLLLAMGGVAWFAARDLRARGARTTRSSIYGTMERPSFVYISAPPSLKTVREALRRADQPIMVRWIVYGAMVTIGVMIAGLALSVAFGAWAKVDFSVVDEHDVTTTAPVALLGSGLLAAFPVSGYLIARASALPTLLEPALATALAIVLTLIVLGLAAPIALLFALAFSPIAWGLACAGAWVGRPAR
jgi:RsiW-degrading membrane proteinase PrsW (M82 family)